MSAEVTPLHDQFFASCPTGLEEVLVQEINSIGITKTKTTKGGVHFDCEPISALELMLASRLASRIYRKAFHFAVKVEKDIYYRAKEISWKEFFSLEQNFKISVVQGKSEDGKKRSRFKSSIFLAQNLKDGIVDQFRLDHDGERPSVEKDSPDMTILMRVEPQNSENSTAEDCYVLIDMCGEPLSMRGYRESSFAAPLKENLAAGVVMLSGYTGKEHFIDPMCGSGTIIIESLLIKGNIPPSYLALHEILTNNNNSFWSFQNHLWFTKDSELQNSWRELLETYIEKARDGFETLEKSTFKTVASDIQGYALKCLKENLEASDLAEFVEINKADATEVESIDEAGVIICNPPYGERIGSDDDLPELYYNFGENLKKSFKGYRAYVFTGNLPLIKKISLRTSKKHILFNGNIETRLAEYLMY